MAAKAATKFVFALALLFSLSSLAAAAVQQDGFGAVLEKIGRPISVEGNLSFQKMIPGYDYSSQVRVAWAVPMEAVMGLGNQLVTIYVQARPFANNSWLSFEMGGETRKSLAFTINCNVTDGACGIGSALVKRFTAKANAPAEAAYPHYENIVVESSLTPFEPTEEMAAEKLAEDALASATGAASEAQAVLPDSVLISDAQDALGEAQAMIDAGDFGSALALIDQADYSMGLALAQQAEAEAAAAAAASPSAEAGPASAISGFFTGNNLPFAVGLVVLAAIVIAFMFVRRGQEVDVDRLMAEGDGGLVSKKGGESNLNALNRGADNEGDRGFSFKSGSASKPGDPGYQPKSSFLDRYRNKEI